MNYVYNVPIKSQLSTDIFDFKIAKLRAVKICYEVKNSNIQHTFLNANISAIIKDLHLKFSVIVLDIIREGTLSQIFFLFVLNFFF